MSKRRRKRNAFDKNSTAVKVGIALAGLTVGVVVLAVAARSVVSPTADALLREGSNQRAVMAEYDGKTGWLTPAGVVAMLGGAALGYYAVKKNSLPMLGGAALAAGLGTGMVYQYQGRRALRNVVEDRARDSFQAMANQINPGGWVDFAPRHLPAFV